MVSPPDDVTLGEVYRRVVEVGQEVREMHRDLIGRGEYEADQEGHVAAHRALGERIEAVRTETSEVRTDLSGRMDGQVRTIRWVLGGVGAALAVVAAIVLPHLRWG